MSLPSSKDTGRKGLASFITDTLHSVRDVSGAEAEAVLWGRGQATKRTRPGLATRGL